MDFQPGNFFDFKEKYYSNAVDLPTTYLYFSDKGNNKTVVDYDGAPQELKYLEERIGKLLDLDWIRYNMP